MMKIVNDKIYVVAFFVYLIVCMVICLMIPEKDISFAERRKLSKLSKVQIRLVWQSDGFAKEIENVVADQFPFRETYRGGAAAFTLYGLRKNEYHQIAVSNGYFVKNDFEIHEKDVDWSLNRFAYIAGNYLKHNKAYIAVIPDKNYYLGSSCGYFDFDHFSKQIMDGTSSYAKYIDLKEVLSLQDYYYTDVHLRQEKLLPLAWYIANSMNEYVEVNYNHDMTKNMEAGYKTIWLEKPFIGVYASQLGLTNKQDLMAYLWKDEMKKYIVTCYDSGKEETMNLYNFDMLDSVDPYAFYLSGAKSYIKLENPLVHNGKRLIMFRDSFGSNIAPLLMDYYEEITLIDIRYISPQRLGKLVDFDDADVLFLYSGYMINNSIGQFVN